MKKSKRMIAGILAGTFAFGMLLTGCSGKSSITGNKVKLDQGTIEENSIVITVGDTGVKYSEVQNYCYLMKKQYEGSFGNKIWDYTVDDSKTIGDEAKEEIINMITQLKIICATAEEENVSLTNDEKDEALQKAEEIIETATEEDKQKYFLSVQGMSDLYQENALANKMFYIATDDADTEVTDDEARQIKIQYLQVMTKGTNLNGTKIELNEKEKSEALNRAKLLQTEAKGVEDFLEFAKENTDSTSTELTIGKDSTDIDTAAVTAAFALEKGGMSEVIETDTGYYIIYCVENNDEDATYARREEIIKERQTKMFKEKYAKWLGDYEVNISQSFWKIFAI